MKNVKTHIIFVVLILCVINCANVSAHENILDVEYDNCISSYGDGVDEMWYSLDGTNLCTHISHNVSTIKYYFEEFSEDNSYSWNTDVSDSMAEEIKTAYADSMEKWNNVYFYSSDSNGNFIKNKIINIAEGTEIDHNLSIFPEPSSYSSTATTLPDEGFEIIENNAHHMHYSKWKMNVNISHFYENITTSAPFVEIVREITGAHEIGHVLGLDDVENYCESTSTSDHHEEILMGYGVISNRVQNITYKDIAGVAITRGFHTDGDHKWISNGVSTSSGIKLICSICNGVKYVDDLTDYEYDVYGYCNNNHQISSGNMMAVASYGNEDYYKCKYCRYVANFEAKELQNYSNAAYYNNTYHNYYNNVEGLSYSILEEHIYDGIPTWKNSTQHTINCECGAMLTRAHAVSEINTTLCIICGGKVSTGILQPMSSIEVSFVTEKGSYILPNGIIILVEEDIELFISGQLVFYDKNLNIS